MGKEEKYSVLLASANEKFDQMLLPLLPADEYGPIHIVNSIGSARRMMTERSYDILIINAPLKDERGTNYAIDVAHETGVGVMLFLEADIFEEVSVFTEQYGVLTLSKPAPRSVISQSLRLLCATRQRLKRMEVKAASFEDKIEEIKLVNRAKLLLIGTGKFDEKSAHRFIEKVAMDSRSPRRKVAEEIIARYKE